MAVMAAGVHHTLVLAGIFKACGFLNRKSVYISSEQDGLCLLYTSFRADTSVSVFSGILTVMDVSASEQAVVLAMGHDEFSKVSGF